MSKHSHNIKNKQFDKLFESIGWDHSVGMKEYQLVDHDKELYKFDPIAQKRGFAILICYSDKLLKAPSQLKRRITSALQRKSHFSEFMIIISGKHNNIETQEWAVVVKNKYRSVVWNEEQNTSKLDEKIEDIKFMLNEENELQIRHVRERVSKAFENNGEKVTSKFYKEYLIVSSQLRNGVRGINEETDKEHFTSVVMNRLMFLYFLQKKGYLNKDQHYLRNQFEKYENKATNFYNNFLTILFDGALNQKKFNRNDHVINLVGTVPYLNGSLFSLTKAEEINNNIHIPNDTIASILKFMDKYQWHLDDRETEKGNDINPSILGHIFEKYVNSKTKNNAGAYYTDEDITTYMTINTIIPGIIEKLGHSEVMNKWMIMMEQNPNKYMPESIKYGMWECEKKLLEQNLLLNNDNFKENLENADNKDILLDCENLNDVVKRFARYLKLKSKMKSKQLNAIDSLIASNINLHQLLIDYIYDYGDKETVLNIFNILIGCSETNKPPFSVLDPACGSGAFMFASLNVLYDVYEACLDRLQVEQAVTPEVSNSPYWITRNIIIANLYGVDIMHEAVEIAKLRMFLKLVSVAELDEGKENLGIVPLPDMDFNVINGNSLVGFVNLKEIEDQLNQTLSVPSKVIMDDLVKQIHKSDYARKAFVDAQKHKAEKIVEAKKSYANEIEQLKYILDKLWEWKYENHSAINQKENNHLQLSSKPFHWLSTFNEIITVNGGFDIIIGNPPYVESRKIKEVYSLARFEYAKNNIYTYFIEQGYSLIKESGYVSMIVPISLTSTTRSGKVRNIIKNRSELLFYCSFADRPGKLFSGADQKITIFISKVTKSIKCYSTNYLSWFTKERPQLMELMEYTNTEEFVEKDIWYRVGNGMDKSIARKIARNDSKLTEVIKRVKASNEAQFFLSYRQRNWGRCFISKPSDQYNGWKSVYDDIRFETIVSILNSSLFFWFWSMTSDGWDLTTTDLTRFKVNKDKLREHEDHLSRLCTKLMNELEETSDDSSGKKRYLHRLCKPTIDEIDDVLGEMFELTTSEIKYIKNYKLKYRLSGEA